MDVSHTSPQNTTTFLLLSVERLLSFPPSHGLTITESLVNLASSSRRVRTVEIVGFLRVSLINYKLCSWGSESEECLLADQKS